MRGRRQLPLPEDTTPTRLGRLRLGEQYESPTEAKPDRMLPRKLDYFRVDPEDGVTTPEAAASFTARYGNEPRRIHPVLLPASQIEDVLHGGWRKYDGKKMVIACDGQTCDTRGPSGGWVENQPCQCARRELAEDAKDHCKRSFALEMVLPEVDGIGIWDVATTSAISISQLTGSLRLIKRLIGRIDGIPLTLWLTPTRVSPGGVVGTVYTLNIGILDETLNDYLDRLPEPLPGSEQRRIRAMLPTPLDDDQPDRLLVEAVEAAREETPTPEAPVDPFATTRAAVAARMKALTSHERARVKKTCELQKVKFTRDGIVEAWKHKAVELIDAAAEHKED